MEYFDDDDDDGGANPFPLRHQQGYRGRGRGRGGRGVGVFRRRDQDKDHNDGDKRHAGLQLEDDAMVLSYSKRFAGDPGSVIYLSHKISPEFNYFEIEIISWGMEGRIGLGLAHSDYPLGNMPGWRQGSIGYHADDGRLFHENGHGSQFGPKCAVGDRMGCGVEFPGAGGGAGIGGEAARDEESDDNEDDDDDDDSDDDGGRGLYAKRRYGSSVTVYFTRNGERVGRSVSMQQRSNGGLFPAVALHSEGEKVRVDLEVASANPDAREVKMRVIKCAPVAALGAGFLAGVPEDVPVWNRLYNVEQVGNCLHYTSLSNSGLAQCEQPMSLRHPYFELEIVNSGENGYVAIGVAHSKYPFGQHPGWKKFSVAYHADDGKLFNGRGDGEQFGPACKQGDRMGCGIYFRPGEKGIAGSWDPPSSSDDSEDDDENSGSIGDSSSSEEECTEDRRVYVYFTHNGKKIGGCASVVPAGGYFPTVGLMSSGEVVKTFVRAITG
ncbi:SPRY domain-containing protein 3-like [Sycon ciliatum]|uniref:SPRY domain-containing protein 3-like n=1 Tax=Sycon ciliatum TaxID=27933 RepID=UPI0020AD3E77|eukprot:scpid75640/ scgid28298/ SPRY domain-containing protein 3